MVIVRIVTVRALSMRAVVMCTVVVCAVVMCAVIAARCRLVVVAVGGAAVVSVLGFTGQVVVLIAFALVRRAVTLSARVVIAGAHWRFALVPAVVIVVVHLVLVIHLVPLLFANS